MKSIVIAGYIVGSIIGASIFFSCSVKCSVEEKAHEPITIERYIPIESTDSIVHKVNSTKHIIDSLSARCDSLTGELQVATYKLERIRYYNDVAKKGNNITFLRGWINRTLDGNE